MSRPSDKTGRFIRNRTVLHIGKRPGGRSTDIHAISIGFPFRSGSGILQIIFPLMSSHPGPFDIRATGKLVQLACPFPSMIFLIAIKTGDYLCFSFQCIQVQYLHINRIDRGTTIIHIKIISFHIKSRVPIRPDFFHRFPFSLFRGGGTIQHSFAMCGTDIIKEVIMNKKSRRIIFDRQYGVSYKHMLPICKIVRTPVSG